MVLTQDKALDNINAATYNILAASDRAMNSGTEPVR
jgi:hypothetical protein